MTHAETARDASPSPPGSIVPGLSMLAFLVATRARVYRILGRAFADLAEANPDWLTVQFLPLDALRDDLPGSLLVLQQGPPLPQIILAFAARWADDPGALARSLLLVCTCLSLTAATFLFLLLRKTLGWRWRAAAVAGLFGFGPDLVLLEYDGLGQYFYMNLAMTLVVALMMLLSRVATGAGARSSVAAGAVVASLALTRATYSYVALPVVALLAVAPIRHRGRHLAALLLPILVLHGGWSLKNGLVQGDWRWATSTWSGSNALSGLENVGLLDALRSDVLTHPDEHPEWFLERVEEHGLCPWPWLECWTAPPPEIQEADRSLERRVGPILGSANRPSFRILQDRHLVAVRGFAVRQPASILWKLRLGYKLYWFPIRYHATHYLGLVGPDWLLEPTSPPWKMLGLLASGELPEPSFLRAGTWPDFLERPIEPPTADLLGILTWYACFVVLHVLTPLLALGLLGRTVRRRRLDPSTWLFLLGLALYSYSAGLTGLVEFRENMRFRLSVEPLIWWLVLFSVVRTLRWGREGLRASERRTGPPRR